VENGTYTDGLAARTRERLTTPGFNVVEIDSADRFDYAQSQIIDYAHEAQAAAELAKALVCWPPPSSPAQLTLTWTSRSFWSGLSTAGQ
jgi:hypothetical protein